jgi:hypothetical protein
MLTDQDAFDAVVRLMRDPNFEQCMENGICVYWRRDGKRCAIGSLLSLSTAKEAAAREVGAVGGAMSGTSTVELAIQNELGGVDPELLGQLQDMHDDWGPSAYNLEDRIRMIARDYNLTIPDPLGS